MIFRREHPLLARCRLFLQPTGATVVNLLGKSPAPTVTGTPLAGHLGDRSPALELTGSSYLDLGSFTGYGSSSKDISIALRARPTVAVAGDSASGVVTCRTNNPNAAVTGFVIAYSNAAAFGEPGWVWAVHGNNGGVNYLRAADPAAYSDTLGRDVCVVATYSSSTRTARLYVDGRLVAEHQDLTTVWDPNDTASLFYGALNAGQLPFKGLIGPVAIWDRCLSAGEAMLLGHAPWPFYLDEPAPLDAPALEATYTNVVSVVQVYAPGGTVTYSTDVDALAYVGGDLTAVPNPSVVTFTTGVAVGQTGIIATPELVLYHNAVAVSQTYTSGSVVTYTNGVGVGQRYRGLVDGRVDLIGNARYRR